MLTVGGMNFATWEQYIYKIDIDLFIQNLAEMYDYSSGKVAWKMGKWSVHQWKCIRCQRKPISSIEKGQKKCTLLEVRFKQKRRVLQVLHFKCPSGRHGWLHKKSDKEDMGLSTCFLYCPVVVINICCDFYSSVVHCSTCTLFRMLPDLIICTHQCQTASLQIML